ncbi:intraflagellar transport protein 74 homolog [Hetaerina americana]|uniref:intraflagellar transport protein 74 homolog n=1 Tax=Hetaerina americana TaxID=62018 RepID=UPI003A7F2CF1
MGTPMQLVHEDGRPASRRGEAMPYQKPPVPISRPSTARMINQTRSGTAMSGQFRRPMSGTASRLASSVQSQQMKIGTGYGLSTVVNVMDRPVTQQGLSGLSSNGIKSSGGLGSGGRGPQRQVKDISYFMGILRSKVGELTSEITHLAQETEAGTSQRATLALYDKRVKEMAAELTELQGQLSDYNLLLDRVNVSGVESVGLGGGGTWEAEAELAELKARNDVESKRVEELFSLRKSAEEKAKSLSEQIEREQKVAEMLIESLGEDEQMLYSQLQMEETKMQESIQMLQSKMNGLNSEREVLKTKIASSRSRQDAVRVKQQIQEAMERRDSLITSNLGVLHGDVKQISLEEEKARLLERVKSDNIETVTAIRQAEEAEEQAQRLRQDLAGMLQVEGGETHKNQMEYQATKRKEKEIEEFLTSVDEQCQKEEGRIKSTENAIVEALLKFTKHLSDPTSLQPSLDEIWSIKESVSVGDHQIEKQADSSSEFHKRNMAALERKIMAEIKSLRSKMASLEKNSNEVKDLEAMKLQGQTRLKELEEEREVMHLKIKNRKNIEDLTSEAVAKYEILKQKLEDDNLWIVLRNLERRLSQVKQGNTALKEFIDVKKYEQDCTLPKARAIETLTSVQDLLKRNLRPSPLNPSIVGKI